MTGKNDIVGRLALITGASGGIGSACARQLYDEGVNLALAFSSNAAKMDAIVTELRSSAVQHSELPRITIHKVDLASVEQTVALSVDVQREHGCTIDILVANAGYGVRIRDVWDIPLEEFDHTINVNLRASFLLVKGVVDGMKGQNWGRIIFMSSIAAYGGGINGCHYAASKAGLMGMMKNLSARLAAYNISVNDVAPAMVGATGMIPNAEAVPGIVETIPLQRLCEPEEVANAVLLYAKTGFITGQSLIIAGGLR